MMKLLSPPETSRMVRSDERIDQMREDGSETSRDRNKDRSKRLKIYKNGDISFAGKQVIINGRSTRTLEVLLAQLTKHLDATVAIKSLHTPTHGSKINSIDELRDNGEYVAVYSGPFKKMNYLELNQKEPLKFSNKKVSGNMEAPKNRMVVPGRIKDINTGSVTIFIFINGIPNDSPARITFPLKSLEQWPVVMNEVNQRMKQKGRDAKDLYTLDGRRLMNGFELEQGGQYVAVGYGVRGFVKASYGEGIKPSFYVPLNRNSTRKDVLNSKSTDKWRNRPGVSFSSPNSSDLHSFSSSDGSGGIKRMSKNNFYNSDGNFHAKQRHKKYGIKDVNYDEDAGGMFRAKKQRDETRHAQAVRDDGRTRVDFPAEMIGPDDVEDEIEFIEENEDKGKSNGLITYVEDNAKSTYRKSFEKDKKEDD